MTEYAILRQADDGTWEAVGTASARSARSAIRDRVDGSQQSAAYLGEGTYVAVPARSWQPVTVKTETKTELKFS